jgi:hypothetical protein
MREHFRSLCAFYDTASGRLLKSFEHLLVGAFPPIIGSLLLILLGYFY